MVFYEVGLDCEIIKLSGSTRLELVHFKWRRKSFVTKPGHICVCVYICTYAYMCYIYIHAPMLYMCICYIKCYFEHIIKQIYTHILFKCLFTNNRVRRSWVYSLMSFDKYTFLWYLHPNQDKDYFHLPRNFPHFLFHSIPHTSPTSSTGKDCLISFTVDEFCVIEIHANEIMQCLAFFTQQNILGLSYCWIIVFYHWVVFHCVHIPVCFYNCSSMDI